MFGELTISLLLIGTSSISFLANHFVISEVFCGERLQYSHKFEYRQTYVQHPIPAGTDKCLIRAFDGINTLIKYIDIG